MKSALIISGSLVQDHEFIYPYYRLLEDEFDVDVALLGGSPVEGILGTKIPPNKDQQVIDFIDIKVDKYNLLIIPGGAKAMEYLRQNQLLLDIIREFNEKKITIGSICHGAQLLISSKIVKGKKISGYYSVKDDINNAGAEYVDAPFVKDDNIISAPHYKHLGPWMKNVLSEFSS